MKRMIALALCLVMVLGLFTGVAGAEVSSGTLSLGFSNPVTGMNLFTENQVLNTNEVLFYQQFRYYDETVESLESGKSIDPADVTIHFEESTGDAGGFYYHEEFGEWYWDTNGATPGATATLSATINGVTYTYPGTFTISGDSYQSPSTSIPSSKRKIMAEDYVPEREQSFMYPTIVTDETTYYMVIGHGYDAEGKPGIMDHMTSTGISYDVEMSNTYYFDFCTYSEVLGYHRVDASTREGLLAMFDNGLKFSVVPVDTQSYRAENCLPEIKAGQPGWIFSCVATYDRDCAGTFYIQVEGTIDGVLHRAFATEGAFPNQNVTEKFTTLQAAQDYIDAFSQSSINEVLTIDFTGVKELEGILTTHRGIRQLKLIGGYTDKQGNEQRTVFKGSVISYVDFSSEYRNFHFIGAGAEAQKLDDIPEYWPDSVLDKDGNPVKVKNYALSGPMTGHTENCLIEGYYHGIHLDKYSEKIHFGGSDCTYRHNKTAIYCDYWTNQGGGPGNWGCTFEENGTAIELVHFPDVSFKLLIDRAKFINNDVDVSNTSGKILWMPFSYFVHDKNLESGKNIYNSEPARTPVLKGTITSNNKEVNATIACPIAWDEDCNTENYYFLSAKKFTIDEELSVMYPKVTFKEMSKRTQQVMLLSDEEETATEDVQIVDFVEKNKWVASMEIVMPTEVETPMIYSRRTLQSAPQQFYYTMYRDELQTGEVTVDMPLLPSGATGEGQTWIGESWVSVTVTANGQEVDSSVEDGIVTFTMLSADDVTTRSSRMVYTITPVAQADVETDDETVTVTITGEPDDGSTFTVKVPEDWKGETVIVTAPDGTETEAKVAEDGTVTFPVDQEGEYILEKKESGLSGLLGAIIGALGGIGNDMDFDDVAKDAWYYDDVAWAYNEGLMNGTGEGRFSPNAATSRAMIVTILWRLEGSPMGMEQSSFSDVVRSSWYGYAVDWAAAFGIVEGYDGKFAPNDAITREQLAAILYRYAKYKGYDVANTQTGLNGFTDADKVSDWALAPMQWAVGNSLINGTNDALNCGGTATRAQTAAILHRFFG